jgi:hypothetical protein
MIAGVPDLARSILPNGIDQLWVSPQIHPGGDRVHVFGSDAYSRHVIGWAIQSRQRDL